MWRFCPVFVLAAAGWLASCGCEEPELSCGGPAVRMPDCPSYIGTSCNAIGVPEGLEIVLPELGEGAYVLEGEADGQPFSCSWGDPAVSGGMTTCTGAAKYYDGILLDPVPCRLTAELRHGDEVVAGGTFRPDYRWDEPWGENCGFRAYARVELEADRGPITER